MTHVCCLCIFLYNCDHAFACPFFVQRINVKLLQSVDVESPEVAVLLAIGIRKVSRVESASNMLET